MSRQNTLLEEQEQLKKEAKKEQMMRLTEEELAQTGNVRALNNSGCHSY
jgi:hypothetical protein